MHSKARGSNRGFTLIEMLVVIGLIGILAGVGFISMMQYRMVIRSNTGLREVTAQMRVARAKAIKKNHPYMFWFKKHSGSPNFDYYGYCMEGTTTSGGDVECGGDIKTFDLPAGIAFTILNFGATGSMPGANKCSASVTISLTDNCPGSWPYTSNKDEKRQFKLNPDGSASHNAAVYIAPPDDSSTLHQRGVSVVSLSGRVRAWKYSGSGWK